MWADVPDEVVAGTTKVAPPNLGYPPLAPLARGDRVTVVDDAAHALSAVSADRIDVFAHSYGASVALALLPLLGARVRSVFLFEPVLFGALREADVPEAAFAREVIERSTLLRADDEAGGEAWLAEFVDYWNRPGSWARLPEAARVETRRVAWKMVQEVRSCFFDVTSFDDVSIPLVPTTLVTAERSPHASRAMTRLLADRHPHAVLVDLPGTGHMAPLTHPRLVHAAMLDHRRRAPAR